MADSKLEENLVSLPSRKIVTDYVTILSMMSSENLREILRATCHGHCSRCLLSFIYLENCWKEIFGLIFRAEETFGTALFPWPFEKGLQIFAGLWRFATSSRSFACTSRNWCNLGNFFRELYTFRVRWQKMVSILSQFLLSFSGSLRRNLI